MTKKKREEREGKIVFLKKTNGYSVHSSAYDSLLGKLFARIGKIKYHERYDKHVFYQSPIVIFLETETMEQIISFLEELNA